MPALDAKATWIKHPGTVADYEIQELTKSVKGNAWLIPSPDGNGAAIFAQPIHTLDSNESATGMVLAYLESREASSEAIWLVQDGKASLQQPAEPEAEQRHPFAATVKKVLEADERTEFFLSIEFLSRADAAKFKAASKDPSSPTEEEEE